MFTYAVVAEVDTVRDDPGPDQPCIDEPSTVCDIYKLLYNSSKETILSRMLNRLDEIVRLLQPPGDHVNYCVRQAVREKFTDVESFYAKYGRCHLNYQRPSYREDEMIG